jgi:hypothetical protein
VFDEIFKDKKLEFNSYITGLNSKGVHEIWLSAV